MKIAEDGVKAATKVLLVDDHALFRESLVRLLDADPSFEVVGHCGAIDEAMNMIQESSPNLLLLDYELGGQKATALLRKLPDLHFSGRIVILTAGVSDAEARELLGFGVAGGFF